MFGMLRESPAIIESLVDQFLEVLPGLHLEICWVRYTNFMTWAFLLAVNSCPRQVQRQWFLSQMVKGGRGKITWQWQNVRHILLGYFYLDRLYETEFQEICQEIRRLNDLAAHTKPEEDNENPIIGIPIHFD